MPLAEPGGLLLVVAMVPSVPTATALLATPLLEGALSAPTGRMLDWKTSSSSGPGCQQCKPTWQADTQATWLYRRTMLKTTTSKLCYIWGTHVATGAPPAHSQDPHTTARQHLFRSRQGKLPRCGSIGTTSVHLTRQGLTGLLLVALAPGCGQARRDRY